jgi:hypothetical protein
MPHLPIVGSDNDIWGAILNEYLQYEHKADGTHNFGVFNALTFGAKGDGLTDDTPAIQAALNAAAPVGGVVWLPPGPNAYRCNSSLTIPGNVTFKGGYGGMRRGLRLWLESPRGSVIHVYTTANFINMSSNSILDGIEIYYPNQKTQGTPDSYGWTISMLPNQHGATIRNICATNPYQFIYANADGFLIDGVQGFPLAIGIQLDRVADVARINNVHFNGNCWLDAQQSLRDWVQTNGVCMIARGAEEFMINSFFAYGYLRGIWFEAYTPDPNFPGNYGSLNVFGFDGVQEGILIETRGISGRQGFSVSNGRIIPFQGQVGARTGIKFIDTVYSLGPGISINNVGFFGPHERSIWIGPNSGARICLLGGQSTEYTKEMVLCQSPYASVRLIGVRSFNGNGPRINNTGGGDTNDIGPITF